MIGGPSAGAKDSRVQVKNPPNSRRSANHYGGTPLALHLLPSHAFRLLPHALLVLRFSFFDIRYSMSDILFSAFSIRPLTIQTYSLCRGIDTDRHPRLPDHREFLYSELFLRELFQFRGQADTVCKKQSLQQHRPRLLCGLP